MDLERKPFVLTYRACVLVVYRLVDMDLNLVVEYSMLKSEDPFQ